MKKTLLLGTLTLILSLSLIAQSSAYFSDVDVETDYQKAILWMQNNEVINGYNDGTFQPDRCVSRSEFLKILFKMLAVDTSTSTAALFKDTKATDWHAPYIRTARERKTIQGYEDGRFRPDQCVTRVEAIKMASLEFNNGLLPEKTYNVEDLPSDLVEIIITGGYEPWYLNYLNYALLTNTVGLKHTLPHNDPAYNYAFLPEEEMSRKEVAEMLYRMKATKDRDTEIYDEDYAPNALVTKSAEVNLKIDKIILTSGESSDTIDFDLYLERPDLELKEDFEGKRTNGLSVDLSKDLQPKLMYLSTVDDTDQDTGSMCDRPRYPHRCQVITKGEEMKKSSHELLLKITFEDDNNSYVAQKIVIPHPAGLKKPEITYPTTTPSQNSTMNVKFKDVGAMSYEVQTDLCEEYGDDGINPCLDGVFYTLNRTTANGPLTFAQQDYANNPSVVIENGYITVKSDFKLVFEESVNYNITASTTNMGQDSIEYTLKNSASKYLPKKSGGGY